jgi:beta-glucosidase/6-phospho-beta-glucosidase/beta-galactosidase
MRNVGLIPIVTLNHFTLPLWVLTPPDSIAKNIVQQLLPSPLRDAPIGEPSSTDSYWNSLRGWENYRTVEEFVKFVERVVTELKDLVDYWITINEPVASIVGVGYIAGLSPPGFFLNGRRAKLALHNLIEAHVQAYDKITQLDDVDADGDGLPKRVGFGHLMISIIPAKPSNVLSRGIINNNQAAENASYFLNDYFINAVVNGEEDLNYLNALKIHDKNSKDFIIHDNWKNKVDFIGLNYYRRIHVYYSIVVALSSARFVGGAFINDLNQKRESKQQQESEYSCSILNDLGWEIYPQGIYEIIMQLKNKYDKPIFVTENGIADKHDRYRAPFIVAHIQQIKRAIDDGANVIGYLHWSLMDNYEWQESYRSEAKFGLFRIDIDSENNETDIPQYNYEQSLKRQITKGAEAYKLIIKESISQSKNGIIADSAISKSKSDYGLFTADGSSIVNSHN